MLWHKLTALTVRRQLMIAALTLVLLSYLFYAALIAPQRDHIRELEMQRGSEMQKLKQVDDFVLAHPSLEAYLAELDQRIVRNDALLPKASGVGDLLIQIQQAAQDSQVEVFRIVPGTYLNKNGYYEIPVELGVRGRFFNIIDFIRRYESLARFISTVTVNIQVKQGVLECKIPLIVYTFGAIPVQNGVASNSPPTPAPASK